MYTDTINQKIQAKLNNLKATKGNIFSNESNKYFLYILLLIIIIFGAFISYKFPFNKSEDHFFNLGILDSKLNINDYFPGTDNIVPLKTNINWFLYLKNNMNEESYVKIKAKIIDYNQSIPNSITGTPSTVDAIWSKSFMLKNGETLITPFNWSILSISQNKNMAYIKKISINNSTIPLNIELNLYYNPRIVFELYIYNFKTEKFEFQWVSNGVKRCSWCQIQFHAPLDVLQPVARERALFNQRFLHDK